MGRVVVEVAGGHYQVGGVGRLDQQAAARAQGVMGSFEQLEELVDVEVLDDVEGGDHVEGAGRQSQQVRRGLGVDDVEALGLAGSDAGDVYVDPVAGCSMLI